MEIKHRLRKRRSFSQGNGIETQEGPMGAQLIKALRVPKNAEEVYQTIHGFHAYPGRFHPHLVETLLKCKEIDRGSLILDPFMGSGTVPVVAQEMGFGILGNDLNPISLMIAKQKLLLRSKKDAELFLQMLKDLCGAVAGRRKRVNKRDGVFLAKYYRPHTFAEMLVLWDLIRSAENKRFKRFAMILFSSAVIKYAQVRSDSQNKKEQVKHYPKGAVTKYLLRRGELLLKQQVERSEELKDVKSYDLHQKDVGDLPDALPNKADVIITSPPYPGTYDYAQHHELRMKWLELESKDFKSKEWGARRAGEQSWAKQFPSILKSLRSMIKDGGLAFIVIGDWIERDTVVNARESLSKYCESEGFTIESAASIGRATRGSKTFLRDGKKEHLIALRAV